METAPPVPLSLTPVELIRLYEITKRTTREKARLFVSVMGVLRLYALTSMEGTAASRHDLFGLPRTLDDSDYPAVTKEASGRSWQATFLDALVRHGYAKLAVVDGQRLYKPGDVKKLQDMVSNAVLVRTDELKALLWPSQYGSQEEEPVEEEQTEVEEPPSPEAPAGVDVIEKVANTLQEVAQHLSGLYKTTGEQNQRSIALSQALDGLAGRLESGLKQFEVVAGEEGRRVNAQLLELLTRHGEIDVRKKSLINQLEAESRKAEQVLTQISETLKRGS
jgi:hypothetical protein